MFVTSAALSPNPAADNGAATCVVNMGGFSRATIGLQSDHAGTLSAQRYLDQACTVPVGAVATQALVAGTANSIGFYDGLPSGFMLVKFQNNAGAVANLSKFSVLLLP